MKQKTFKVELDIETMEKMIQLIEFSNKNFPFTASQLWDLRYKLSDIILKGCFKHNIIMNTVRDSINSSITFCPKCNPKYLKVKRYEE
jgi:hypothetical protein